MASPGGREPAGFAVAGGQGRCRAGVVLRRHSRTDSRQDRRVSRPGFRQFFAERRDVVSERRACARVSGALE